MPTVRIELHTHQLLRQLAEESSETMQTVLARAIEAERRRRFFQKINSGYAALSEKESDTLSQEQELWETTLMDGLE